MTTLDEDYDRRNLLDGIAAGLFPQDSALTGRKFISPCCTAATLELVAGGRTLVATRVAGHGWLGPARLGSIDAINDTGTIVEADGRERAVHWSAEREQVR